jgi:hypothetical protein
VSEPDEARRFSMKKRRRHIPEQMVRKLREADAMLSGDRSVRGVIDSVHVANMVNCQVSR